MTVLRIERLPGDPLAAAAAFHADWLPRAEQALGADAGLLVLAFAPADHTHCGWRLAAVQGLARAAVPQRVNAVEAEDEAAIASALAYLEAAPGLTGQYLPLDGLGAGDVIGSPA